MNLRKATKKALIHEIKELRRFKELCKELQKEIERRDDAKWHYDEIKPCAVAWALQLYKAETLKEKDLVWEAYWKWASEKINQKRINQFWAERMADLIADCDRWMYTYEEIPVGYITGISIK